MSILPTFTLSVICLFLVMTTAYADDAIVFMNTPDSLSMDETITVVKQAALKRKWSISKQTENELEITLENSDYKSKILFSFYNQQIRYIDQTVKGYEDDYEDETEYKWEKSRVPRSWLRNLSNDTLAKFASKSKLATNEAKLFTYAPPSVSTHDSIEILKYVSEKRRWVVTKHQENLLQVELNQTNYIAKLEFSVSGNEILYTDLTKLFRTELGDSEAQNSKVPRNWLLNLKKDMYNVFPLVQHLKNYNESPSLADHNKTLPDGTKLLASIPASISKKNVIDVLRYVSKNRRWVTSSTNNSVLRIRYENSDYSDFEAMLDFFIVGNEIRYTDLTKQYVDRESNNETTKSEAPHNWITNLKKDLKIVIPFAQTITQTVSKNSDISSQLNVEKTQINN